MTTSIPPEQWRVVLANTGRTVITHPDDVASMLTDENAAGTISIRRRSAVPNEHGRLPYHWHDLDVFAETDLDDVEVEHGEEMWRLMQAAAEGMNQADRAREVPQ